MTWMTDMTHFLDEDGLIAEMPAPASRLVDYFGQIVSAASSTSMGISVELDVECRRRPGRRRCGGRIEALIDAEDCIRWGCPVCGDNGYISRWRGTPWDRCLV